MAPRGLDEERVKGGASPALMAGWFGIALLLAYLLFVGGTGYGTSSSTFRLVTYWLAAAFLAVWFTVGLVRPHWRPASSLGPALIVCLMCFAVATVASWNSRLSVDALAYASILIALYVALVSLLRSPFLRPRLVSLIVMTYLIVCAVYLFRAAGTWLEWYRLVGLQMVPLRPRYDGLFYGNPNELAAFVVLALATIGAYYGIGTRRRVWLTAGCALIGAGVVVVSGSRGAWLAIVTGSLATIVVLVVLHRASIGRLRPRLRPLIAAVGAAAIVAMLSAPAVLTRIDSGGGQSLRLDLASNALEVGAASPLTGSGPGTWAVRRAMLTPPEIPDLYVPHAHNIYAQAFAEFGILALIAAAALGVGLVRLLVEAHRDTDPTRRRFAVAAVFCIGFAAGQQAVDFAANIPAVLFLVAFPFAYLDATRAKVEADQLGLSRGHTLRLVLVGSVAISLVWLSWSEGSARFAEQSMSEAELGDWDAAYQDATRAHAGDPRLPVYSFNLGVAASRVGQSDEAKAAFLDQAAADDFPVGWLNLASLEIDDGNVTAADDYLGRAMRLGYQQSVVALPAGDLWLRMGITDKAVAAYAAALRATPSLAASDYWSSSAAVSNAFSAALPEAVRASPAPVAWEIALFSGNDALLGGATTNLGERRREVAELIASVYRGDAHVRELEARAVKTPNDLSMVGWCARLAHLQGERTIAARCRRILKILTPDWQAYASTATVESAVRRVRHEEWGAAGTYRYYGLYLYRRPVMTQFLVPGLPRVLLTPLRW